MTARALGPACLALLLAGCPMRGRDGQLLVGKIETDGNAALERDALVGRIAHAESGRWILGPLWTWGKEEPFDAQLVLADAKRMERVYARNGYFEAEVTVDDPAPDDGRVDLRFHVVEGEPTRLARLSVRFADGLTDADEREVLETLPLTGKAPFTRGPDAVVLVRADGLPSVSDDASAELEKAVRESTPRDTRETGGAAPARITLHDHVATLGGAGGAEGPVLLEDEWVRLKELLQLRVRTLGHVVAEVNGELVIDRTTHRAVGSVVVTPGPRYRVEKVVVFGAQGVSRERIAQAAGVAPDSPVTPRTLADVQRRVYALGVFSLVQVDLGLFRPDKEARGRTGRAPIVVTVSEAPLMSLEVGAGVEADQARQVARARAMYQHRSFFGGLRKFTVEGALGYVWLPSVLDHVFGSAPAENRSLVWAARTELVQPRVSLLPFDLSVAIDASQDVTQAFRYRKVGGHVSTPVHFEGLLRPLKLVPSVNFEGYQGEQTGVSTTVSTTACGPGTSTVGASLACKILYGELAMAWDVRNDPLAPTSGFVVSLKAQLAGTPASDFAYARVEPDLRVFQPITDRLTLAGHLRYGALVPLGDHAPPGVALFFAGGANSVRVAGAQQVGPRRYIVRADAEDVPRANVPAPLGGTRLLEGGVEARWRPTGGALALVLFVDAGAVSTGTDWLPDAKYVLWGPGVGVRYHVEGVGPLRLDVGWRVPGSLSTPDVVDVGTTGVSTSPADYTIAPRCAEDAYTCFQETLFGSTLFLNFTLGEAF